jgi:hypothetical protein
MVHTKEAYRIAVRQIIEAHLTESDSQLRSRCAALGRAAECHMPIFNSAVHLEIQRFQNQRRKAASMKAEVDALKMF